MEVSEIAAIVSLNEVNLRQNMILKPLDWKMFQEQYKTKSKLLFELVQSDCSKRSAIDPMKPESMFVSNDNSFLARDMFWKIHRASGCNQVVHLLAAVLYELVEKGKISQLVHQGEKIVDILVANTLAVDVSDIKSSEPTVIVPPKFLKNKRTPSVVPLFSTFSDKSSIQDAGVLAGIAIGAFDYNHYLKQFPKEIQANRDNFLPHWWLTLITESRKMVHIDLCGPAYDSFDYKGQVLDLDSGNYCGTAPVHIFETDEYLLMKADGDFAHKLYMGNLLWPNIIRELPTGIRHFNYVKKGFPTQFTPLETYLTKNQSVQSVHVKKKISDIVSHEHFIGKFIQPGSGIKVIQKGSSSGHVGKVISRQDSLDKGIVLCAKLQGNSDPVTLDIRSSSISLFPPAPTKPFRTLEAIHADIDEAQRYNFAQETRRVIIHGLQSEAGASLNGREATVIRDALVKPRPFGDTRWSVQLVDSQEIKSIAGKNLKIAEDHTRNDSGATSSNMNPSLSSENQLKLQKLFREDPHAQELLQQMNIGNSGFTVISDPKYRRAVKVFMKTGLLPSEGMFKDALKIADHPRGESFRQLIVRMKTTGIDGAELEDPDYKKFMEILQKHGLFRART